MSARVRGWVSAGVLASGLIACGKKDAEDPPKDFSNPAAPGQPVPAKFALADFQTLRYLEGTWKGMQPNGSPFYESYHFINDSTLLQGTHTDSTFKTKSDSSLILFRNGVVMDSSFTGRMSVAEKLDSSIVDFRAGPNYHFAWTRQSADAWKAILYNRQPDGTDRITTYLLTRVRK
jgi:hypothetical protein